jgi:hypothetical protein
LSTSNSSTPPLAKLERLLLDGDIDVELALYLRAVGFGVRFAPRGSKLIRDDVKVLQLARRLGRILVCHDQHGDKETKVRLYPELYRRGGKILQISGDSSQPPLTALGKILLFRENWQPWFKDNDGKVLVYKGGFKATPAHELAGRTVQRVFEIGPVPLGTKRKPRKRSPRARVVPVEQRPLFE